MGAAIATAGTSAILTGALVGAAVGAGVATAAIAVSDAKSRNNRGTLDAIFGVAGGALFGAMAGASIAAVPFAAEFYAPLVDAGLIYYGINIPVVAELVTAGFYGITGLNALFTANNVIAMNSGYDFLGSTLFKNHPDLYMGIQLLTYIASMNILGTGLMMEGSESGDGPSDGSDGGIPEGRNRIPDKDSVTKHIFRATEGHIQDTPENRALLESVANDKLNFQGIDKYNNEWYVKMQDDGSQI